jgi:hypothetical protein
LTSTQWTEYSENTKGIQYSAVLTSDITAEAVTVDGFVLSQKDTAGVVTSSTRSYTASGMLLTQTDGPGNTTTTINTYGWGKRIMEWNGAFAYGVLASRARAHVILLVML